MVHILVETALVKPQVNTFHDGKNLIDHLAHLPANGFHACGRKDPPLGGSPHSQLEEGIEGADIALGLGVAVLRPAAQGNRVIACQGQLGRLVFGKGQSPITCLADLHGQIQDSTAGARLADGQNQGLPDRPQIDRSVAPKQGVGQEDLNRNAGPALEKRPDGPCCVIGAAVAHDNQLFDGIKSHRSRSFGLLRPQKFQEQLWLLEHVLVHDVFCRH